jgi:hypothetical protein
LRSSSSALIIYYYADKTFHLNHSQRIAVAENSFGGVVNFNLSENDMDLLRSLDVDYKAGKLGRRDGWKDEDVTSDSWDPTDAC